MLFCIFDNKRLKTQQKKGCCNTQIHTHIRSNDNVCAFRSHVKLHVDKSNFNVISFFCNTWNALTHWGRVTHICVNKLTIIGSDNGLSPGWRQAIIWTNAGLLSIRTLGTNFSEILSEIHAFSFKKMHLKMASILFRPQCVKCDQTYPAICARMESPVTASTLGLKWRIWRNRARTALRPWNMACLLKRKDNLNTSH